MTDNIKFGFAVILVIAGIVGFYVFADSMLVLRVLMVLAGLGSAAGVAWYTEPGQNLLLFSREAVKEARKVVWPTRKETLQTTGIVFVFVAVMALLLWVVDAGLLALVQWLMGRGGS